jgi:hypothetical protein
LTAAKIKSPVPLMRGILGSGFKTSGRRDVVFENFDTDLHAYFHRSVGVEWNDDLSFAAATFYLDALGD